MSQTVFRDYVNTHRHVVFDGGAEVLLGRLSAAAEAVGTALNESLRELAEKVSPFDFILVLAVFILSCRLKCQLVCFGKASQMISVCDRRLSKQCLRCWLSWICGHRQQRRCL